MIWRQRVARIVGGITVIVGLIYVNEIAVSIRAAAFDRMHWDPRYLVLVCGFAWTAAGLVLSFIFRLPIRHVALWTLLLAGIGGVASALLSQVTVHLLLVLIIASSVTYATIHSIVISGIATAAWFGVTVALGRDAGFFLVSGTALVLISVWLRYEFGEWSRRTALFDQASWAAAQYAKVNTTMLNRLDQSVEIARLRERERIAREVHDTVGYALTASLVQLRAARRQLDISPNAAGERLIHVEEMVKDSLQDVRREVSNLRDEAAVRRVGMSRWRRLCEVFSTSTGMRVSVNLPNDLEVVSEEISESVYRIIQESLTNAYRHGGADHVDVSGTWRRNEAKILIRVSDNGRGGGTISPGNGLSGMRERLDQLGGTLAWVTKPGRGFDLGIEIPWNGANDVEN